MCEKKKIGTENKERQAVKVLQNQGTAVPDVNMDS